MHITPGPDLRADLLHPLAVHENPHVLADAALFVDHAEAQAWIARVEGGEQLADGAPMGINPRRAASVVAQLGWDEDGDGGGVSRARSQAHNRSTATTE